MNITKQNTAIFGLLKAYKMLEGSDEATNKPVEMRDIEKDISDVFGWSEKLTRDEFKMNVQTIYELVGM